MSIITASPYTTLRTLMGARVVVETIGGVYRGLLADFTLDSEYHVLGIHLVAFKTPHLEPLPPCPCFILGRSVTGIMVDQEVPKAMRFPDDFTSELK